MSTISVTNINDGDAVTAASINNQVNTIVNDYNGNITAANLASNAITTAKITNANVTADKLATGASTSNITTSESTASTTFVALATPQAVTVTIGANGLALVIITVEQSNSGANFNVTSVALSGATTLASADDNGVINSGTSAFTVSRTRLWTGLAVGSTTFTLQHRATAGTGTFLRRNLTVIPL